MLGLKNALKVKPLDEATQMQSADPLAKGALEDNLSDPLAAQPVGTEVKPPSDPGDAPKGDRPSGDPGDLQSRTPRMPGGTPTPSKPDGSSSGSPSGRGGSSAGTPDPAGAPQNSSGAPQGGSGTPQGSSGGPGSGGKGTPTTATPVTTPTSAQSATPQNQPAPPAVGGSTQMADGSTVHLPAHESTASDDAKGGTATEAKTDGDDAKTDGDAPTVTEAKTEAPPPGAPQETPSGDEAESADEKKEGSLDKGGQEAGTSGVDAPVAGTATAEGGDGGGDLKASDGPQANTEETVDASGDGDTSVADGAMSATTDASADGVTLGPVATPELGVGPFLLAPPPPAPKAMQDAIAKQTGKTLQQHRQAVENDISRIVADAASLQAAAVSETTAQAAEISSQLEAGRATLLGGVDVARAGVTSGIDGARTALVGAADAARASVKGGRATALGAIAGAASSATARAKKFYDAQASRYEKMNGELLKPFETMLGAISDKTKTDGSAKAKEFAKLDVASAVGAGQGNAMDRYIATVRKTWMEGDLKKASGDMATGANTRASEMLAQIKPLQANITALLTPLVTRVKTLGDEGAAAVAAAQKSATAKLEGDTRQALQTIDAAVAGATQHLDAVKAATTAQFDALTANVDAQVNERKVAAEGAFQGAGARFADQYRDQIETAAKGFPANGPITADAVKGYLDQTQTGLNELRTRQGKELSSIAADTRARFEDGRASTMASVTSVQQGIDEQLNLVATEQLGGFSALAAGFVGSLGEIGPSVTRAFDTWLSPVQAQLSAHEAQVKAQNETVRSTLNKTLSSQHTEWLGTLATTIKTYLAGAAAKSYEGARPAREKVEDRAKKCFQAMRGMGTDENKLFDALRAMVPLEPQATTQVFSQISGGEDLDTWLKSELNAEEYGIASAHYNLQHGAAARAEINYNISFWGDDEAQIEAILRGLPKDEREKIQTDNKAEWQSTLKKLESNLDGNDLKVVNALAENNVSRADAIRLKEKVDKARMEKDDDAMHEALEGMDQTKLDDIAKEFAALDGVGEKGAPPDANAARQEMAKYVTRDVPTLSGGQVDKGTLSIGSRDLATSLIMNGNDSVDTRAARLKNEMDRPGGPNEEKLEKALYVNDDLKAKLHDPDPTVRKAAEAEAAEQQKQLNDKFKTQYKVDAGAAMAGNKNIGDDKKNLFSMMLKDGYNSPDVAAKQIDLARQGWGTDEEAIKRALAGMSKADIAKTKEKFEAAHPGETLDKALGIHKEAGFGGELSGQDRIDVEILMMGDEKYMNDDDRMALAEKKYDVQRGSESNMVGKGTMSLIGSYETAGLENNMADLKKFRQDNASKFKDGKFAGSPAEYEEYRAKCRLVGITADLYQEQADRAANYVTTGIAIAGAVAGSILSGGTAAPMLIAGVTGLAGIGANVAMKGGRYGYEQGMTDLAVTGVNVATAGLGAKLGAGIDKAYEAGKLSTGGMILQKSLSSGLTGGINNTASTALADETWKKGFDKGLNKTMWAGGKGFATGFASTATTESLSKYKFGNGFAKNDEKGTLEGWMSADKSPGLKNATLNKVAHTGRAGLTKAGVSGMGNIASKSTEIGIDKLRGEYKGEFYNAFEEVGLEGLKGVGQGFAEGSAAVLGKPVTDWYTAKRKTWEENAAKKKAAAEAQKKQSTRVEEDAQADLKKVQTEEQKKLEGEAEKVDQAKVTEDGKEKVDTSKTKTEEEIKAEIEATRKRIEEKKDATDSTMTEEQKKIAAAEKEAQRVQEETAKKEEHAKKEATATEEQKNAQRTDTEKSGTETKGVVGGEEVIKTNHTDPTEDEIIHKLQVMQKEGRITEKEAMRLLGQDPKKIAAFLHDEASLMRILKLQSKGHVDDKDIDALLSASKEERTKKIEDLEYKAHTESEKYPRSLKEAQTEKEPTKKEALVKETIGHFEKSGQKASVEALQKLNGNPDAQLALAHDLAIYHSIITKSTRDITDRELMSLVRAHAALMDSTATDDSLLRKFITDSGAANYANNGKYSNAVKGCIGDAKNTMDMTPGDVVHVLGLDYNDNTYVKKGGTAENPTFTAKSDEAFYIEFNSTSEIRDAGKITVASDLYDRIAQLQDSMPEAKKLMTRLGKKDVMDGDPNNPYAGTGGTAAGNRLGKGSKGTVNQEMDAQKAAALPKGTKLFRMDENGKSVLFATYDGTTWVKTADAQKDARFAPKEKP